MNGHSVTMAFRALLFSLLIHAGASAQFTKLHDFSEVDGRFIVGGVAVSGATIFGTAGAGGAHDGGTIWSFDTANYTPLHLLAKSTRIMPGYFFYLGFLACGLGGFIVLKLQGALPEQVDRWISQRIPIIAHPIEKLTTEQRSLWALWIGLGVPLFFPIFGSLVLSDWQLQHWTATRLWLPVFPLFCYLFATHLNDLNPVRQTRDAQSSLSHHQITQ